jgi:hypothetical protein
MGQDKLLQYMNPILVQIIETLKAVRLAAACAILLNLACVVSLFLSTCTGGQPPRPGF